MFPNPRHVLFILGHGAMGWKLKGDPFPVSLTPVPWQHLRGVLQEAGEATFSLTEERAVPDQHCAPRLSEWGRGSHILSTLGFMLVQRGRGLHQKTRMRRTSRCSGVTGEGVFQVWRGYQGILPLLHRHTHHQITPSLPAPQLLLSSLYG